MFEMGARPHPPPSLYRPYIQQSQVFVGIYHQRYGWIAPNMAVSGIEDEFHLASHLPQLLYIKEPAPEREASLTQLLQAMQARGKAPKPFTNLEELQQLLRADLLELTQHLEAIPIEPKPEPPSSQLPAARTSLIGRDDEIAAVKALLQKGHLAAARQLSGQGLRTHQALGLKPGVAYRLLGLAETALQEGNPTEAREYLRTGFPIAQQTTDHHTIARYLETLALLLIQHNTAQAVRLLSAAQALRQDNEIVLTQAEQPTLQAGLNKLSLRFDQATLEQLKQEGRTLDFARSFFGNARLRKRFSTFRWDLHGLQVTWQGYSSAKPAHRSGNSS